MSWTTTKLAKLANKSNRSPLAVSSARDEFVTSFDRMFDEMVRSFSPEFQEHFGGSFFERGSYPKVNIALKDNVVVIDAELSGYTKEDVSINVKDNVLTISGNSSEQKEDKDTTYLLRELKRTKFSRSFQLGKELDAQGITAKFTNGLLQITVPLKTKTEQTTVEVKIQ